MDVFLGNCSPYFPQYFTKAILLGDCQETLPAVTVELLYFGIKSSVIMRGKDTKYLVLEIDIKNLVFGLKSLVYIKFHHELRSELNNQNNLS